MTARKLTSWFAGCLVVTAIASRAGAQQEFAAPHLNGDAELFAPIDFTFEGTPIRDESGWFFRFDKLSWAFTGERTALGNGDTQAASLNPFREMLTGRFLADGTATPVNVFPPAVLGGINDSPPRAEFGWGERYEFGYSGDENGWQVGIIDGPYSQSKASYGINTQATLFGSVLIVFDDPLNLMMGFIDVIDGSGGTFQPDGLADDIDGDGQFGPDGYDLEDPGRVPDSYLIGDLRADFDDLVLLPSSWQFLDVRNSANSQGIEIMRTHTLDNGHYMAKHKNNHFQIGYGVRYLRLRDEFNVTGSGGVMGLSFWDTRVTNNLVGPQLALNYSHQRHRIRYDFNGRFMFGYNITNFDQQASLGEDLLPGQHNRGLYFSPTYSTHGKQENEFSPTAEMRFQASYQLTSNLALKLGYTAIFVDNISRASQQVRYELPNMGFLDHEAGKQEIFINGANIGFEAVY